ncbi:MAG: ribonuclease R [Bacteroidota bacterium]
MSEEKNSNQQFVENFKEAMLTIFKQNPTKWYNYKQVFRRVYLDPFNEALSKQLDNYSEKELKSLCIDVLEELAENEVLEDGMKGKFRIRPTKRYVYGKLAFNNYGAAFVFDEENNLPVFLAKNKTLNALRGDKVKVSTYPYYFPDKAEGELVEVIERNKKEFSGTVQVSDKFAFLNSDNNRTGIDIFIPLNKLNGARNGQKAVAKITRWEIEDKNPIGEITRVLGDAGENNTEMNAILVEYGFPLFFPAEVEEEADKIKEVITASEIKKRRDYRKITTFTIDPVDAKDFDDALSIQFLPNGNYEIGVHIADVSHYIKEGSALEEEALSRATSIYLVDRVIPMLPEKLSNKVCSLRPGEDKLCYAAIFEIDKNAQVLEEWFGRTVIHSDRRFTYEEAQQVIETGAGDYHQEIKVMHELAQKMRQERFSHGAITFDKVEVKFKLDEQGMPIDVFLKVNKDSNKLIEEFMLLANKRVATFVGKKLSEEREAEQTFVYRVHDKPVPDKLENFSFFAAKFGHKINMHSEKAVAQSFNQLMKDIKGKREENVLEQLAIRTMAKAIYTTENIGHYGLAFDYYTHFTSPIRRYPDVMVHRLLTHYLSNGKSVDREPIEMRCKHSTDMEIKASEAERASVKFKQAQYLMGREGEVFDGMISGVTEWGIYVELVDSKCEGLIRVRDLKDDYYELDENNYCLVGRKTNRRLQLGDPVRVKLKSADLLKKQIDFYLWEFSSNESFGPKENRTNSKKAKPRGFAKPTNKKGKKRR